MQSKAIFTFAVSGLILSFLAGCLSNSDKVRVLEGNEQVGSAPTGSLFETSDASIVHVDDNERLATLRNARDFPNNTFLETRDGEGKSSSIIKTLENRSSGLRTADILEGMPKINDQASPVLPSEKARLEKIYRDPVAE